MTGNMFKPRLSTASIWLALLALVGCAEEPRAPDAVEHFQSDGQPLALHVFLPARGTAPYPTVLFFHGGAWQRGGPGHFHPQCAWLSERGYLCISAAYRVAERDGTTPAHAVQDARAALQHVRRHATELDVDPERIVLSGGSSGGHLAAMLATGQGGIAPPEAAAALVLFNPMLNLEPGRPDHQYVTDQWRELSPHHQVASPLPPTLILVGDRDRDVPLATAQAFCDRVRSFGGTCELDVAARQGHGFFNRQVSIWHFHRTLHTMQDFLAEVLPNTD
jgi:acetyl esterase/lipase